MDDIVERTLNPGVVFTMMAAGLAYGRWLLWSLNLRPTVTLLVTGIAPGVIFLLTVWAIRAIQGVPSLVYLTLLVDWLIFSGVAVAAVLICRRRHGR